MREGVSRGCGVDQDDSGLRFSASGRNEKCKEKDDKQRLSQWSHAIDKSLSKPRRGRLVSPGAVIRWPARAETYGTSSAQFRRPESWQWRADSCLDDAPSSSAQLRNADARNSGERT